MNPPAPPVPAPSPQPPPRTLFGTLAVARAYAAFLAPLFTRLVLGGAFCVAGMNRLLTLEQIMQSYSESDLALAAFDAVFLGCLQCGGGVMLIVGLGTRIFAAIFGILTCVELITTSRAEFVNALTFQGRKELNAIPPFMNGLLLLWLVLYGPGAASFDALNAWVWEMMTKKKSTSR